MAKILVTGQEVRAFARNEEKAQGFADRTTGQVKELSGHMARSIDDFTNDFQSFFQG